MFWPSKGKQSVLQATQTALRRSPALEAQRRCSRAWALALGMPPGSDSSSRSSPPRSTTAGCADCRAFEVISSGDCCPQLCHSLQSMMEQAQFPSNVPRDVISWTKWWGQYVILLWDNGTYMHFTYLAICDILIYFISLYFYFGEFFQSPNSISKSS